MLLIGMFDSPFVRRVAISMKLLGIPFEHGNWSVGKDFDRIRQHNPLGRVPALVLDDGEVLTESSAILDYLDEQAGARALLPRTGPERRHALQVMVIATGAAEKGVSMVYERAFRPPEKRHEPWVQRCRMQVTGALTELNQRYEKTNGTWLLGEAVMQPDITTACVATFLSDAAQFDLHAFPALASLTSRCEAMPEFAQTRLAFFTPSN